MSRDSAVRVIGTNPIAATTAARLPAYLDVGERARVERSLVQRAKQVDPARLRIQARVLWRSSKRAVAEARAHEDAQLREEEESA